MSSFTISKKEYIKAAGFCAGLAARKDRYRDQMLRIWCDKLGKVAGDEEYHKTFTKIYEWNAESVKRQYNDEEAEADNEQYMEAFKQMKDYTIMASNRKLEELIYNFHHFSGSVLYQIEDPELSSKASRVLHKINSLLLGILISDIKYFDTSNSYGAFMEDMNEAENIQRIA